MKTIAISIDQPTLDALDRMTPPKKSSGQGSSRKRANRSALIRRAVSQFIEQQDRTQSEETDRRAFARHRKAIARQAEALVGEQAKP
jgi:metal-responsive CopG/Arc/MetJ family transcriptional regulator